MNQDDETPIPTIEFQLTIEFKVRFQALLAIGRF